MGAGIFGSIKGGKTMIHHALIGWAALLGLICAPVSPTRADAIHDAAQNGDVSRVRSLLQADPHLVNAKHNRDRMPLLYAAEKGHTEVVRLLLQKGADIGARNYEGLTALHFALVYKHPDTARLLIARGADV